MNHNEPATMLPGDDPNIPSRPDMISRLAKYSLYGVLSVSAFGLAVVKAFPEVSLYASFIPEAPVGLADPETRARMTAESNAFWANGGTDAACAMETTEAEDACRPNEQCQISTSLDRPDVINSEDRQQETADTLAVNGISPDDPDR